LLISGCSLQYRLEYQQEKLTYDELTYLRIAIALFQANPNNNETLTKMYNAIPELKEKIDRTWNRESVKLFDSQLSGAKEIMR
jgi:hypothetical protein